MKPEFAKLYAPSVAARLERLRPEERESLEGWLVEHPVGTNYALQIVELLEDRARKSRQPMAWALEEAMEVCEPKASRNAKELGRQVRDYLHGKIHPTSQGHRERFLDFQKGLGLPAGVELIPSPNFEGETFTLQLRFRRGEELAAQVETLRQSLQRGSWKGLEEF